MNLCDIKIDTCASYPEIRIMNPNSEYAGVMLDNYAGINSEMSCISLFMYNSLILESCYPEISSILNKIINVEMRHMKIFGSLATNLGEDPKLWTWKNNRRVVWTPNYNCYSTNLMQIFKNSIDEKRFIISKYEGQKRYINNKVICDCLDRIIEDEEIHLEIFTMLLETYRTKK